MVRGLEGNVAYVGAKTLTSEQAALWTSLSKGTAIERQYPMFVLPVQKVLGLDKLKTHEEMSSSLVEWKPGMGKVVFCSHTWLQYKEPDNDAGLKLALLKDLLSGILDGSVGTLELEHPYYGKMSIPGKQLRDDIRTGYVWFDLMSIPQADRDAQVKAIGSIVSYVTDSAYFFVLAGPWRHEDGSIRDERAWCRRGWCRMEACANALSPASKPVAVCRSVNSVVLNTPAGITKKSALFDTVGQGAFTVEADKQHLGAVVNSLIEVRKEYALRQGDLITYRVCHCATAKLLQGGLGVEMPPPESYEEWMASMRFKESELATEGKATGLTPLRYAVYANRLDIVRRMLAACPGLDVEAPLKFSIPLVEGPKAQTVLMAACAWYDNPEMVRALHNAGADMCRLDKGIGHFSPVYAAGNSNLRNIDVLLEIGVNHQGKRVDAWHGSPISLPDLEGVVYPPNFGVMVMFAEYGHVDGLKAFAAAHPADWARVFQQPPPGKPHLGLSIITHSVNVGGDVDMLMWLCDQAKAHGCDGPNFRIATTDKKALKLIGIFKTVLCLMRRPPMIVMSFLNCLFSASPMHAACFNGNLGAVDYLISHGADINTQLQLLGRTPLMLAAIGGHESICARLVEAGASLTILDLRKRKTAAQWAAYYGRHELARRLTPPSSTTTPRGKTPSKNQVAPAEDFVVKE